MGFLSLFRVVISRPPVIEALPPCPAYVVRAQARARPLGLCVLHGEVGALPWCDPGTELRAPALARAAAIGDFLDPRACAVFARGPVRPGVWRLGWRNVVCAVSRRSCMTSL